MKKLFAYILMLALIFTAACSSAPPEAAPSAAAPEAPSAAAPEASRESEMQDGGSAQSNSGQEYGAEYYGRDSGGEAYLDIDENKTHDAKNRPLSTISLKVDTAAYSNVARYIMSGTLPPVDAVRTEELINYFKYDGEMTFGEDPFAISTQIGRSPFDAGKYMAFIRVKSRDIDRSALPPSSLTFLIDTSGSMNSYDKLPLLQEAFDMLLDALGENDRVSIVTYAGSSEIVLSGASGTDKAAVRRAIYSLSAGGSTAGSYGILAAYGLAQDNFIPGGNNRIILASDGDFNVGISDLDALNALVSQKREGGVYLSVLGFGTGNLRDDIMETLAANGNGNYSYIDSVKTAQKVLVDEMAANLFTLADDVKAQVEFNPENVLSYRMVGYENRTLNARDFDDDRKDAGEIGAGTDVVIMFELELARDERDSGALKYQDDASPVPSGGKYGDELFEVRIRYKNPGQNSSNLMVVPATYGDFEVDSDFSFACSVAAFGELLRGSHYSSSRIGEIKAVAQSSLGRDENGYRADFVELLSGYEALR